MNFYLKAADSSHKGFEFTHKSFGDYLAARAILKMAAEVMSFVPRFTDSALQLWIKGTGTGTLTVEILGYMRDEIKLRVASGATERKKVEAHFKSAQTLARTVIDEGLPAHTVKVDNWRAAARMQKNAEIMLWAVLNSYVINIQTGKKITLIDVGFGEDRLRFKTFLARVVLGDDSRPPAAKCLSYVSAEGSDLFALELSGADFQGSMLERVNLNGCHLMDANMSRSNLRQATLQRASLDDCKFNEANIDEAMFVDSRPMRTDLFAATTGTVRISRRTLLDIPLATDVPSDRIALARQYEDDNNEWSQRVERADALWNEAQGRPTEDATKNDLESDGGD